MVMTENVGVLFSGLFRCHEQEDVKKNVEEAWL